MDKRKRPLKYIIRRSTSELRILYRCRGFTSYCKNFEIFTLILRNDSAPQDPPPL